MAYNVRRYVQLVRRLADGGACFCTRGAMYGYDVILFIVALAKTVTPGEGPRREPGRPAPPYTVCHFDRKILAVQKPIEYTDLLAAGGIFKCDKKRFWCHNR
jgi:hypothetical protein